jgi:hypothetical protein
MKGMAAGMVLILSASAWAQDWISTDARSKATGNAGVAFAEGAGAAYWNPSSLAQGSEEALDFTAGFSFTGYGFTDVAIEGDILSQIDRVADLYNDVSFQASQDRINAGTHTSADVQNAMRILDSALALNEDGKGVVGHLGVGLDFKYGPFGFFVRRLGSVGVDPFTDFSVPNSSALSSTSMATFFGGLTGGALSSAGASLRDRLVACGLTGDADSDGTADAAELAFQAQTALGVMREASCFASGTW